LRTLSGCRGCHSARSPLRHCHAGGGAHGGVMYGEPLSPEQQQQAFLSRLLLMLGSFVIMCLLLF
jgi:E3 ubiquitin-protein ligase RNF5